MLSDRTCPDRTAAEFVVHDPRFAGTSGDRFFEVPFEDGRWLEGPAYHAAGRFCLFSDIPNNRVLRYDEVTGRVDEFCHNAGFANGRTLDRQSRFISCQHGTRSVTRLEHDGSVTVLADRYRGARLNSPNDVVTTADGTIWFTDPTYGIRSDYEGHYATPEVDGRHVFRLAPDGGLTVVVDDFTQPNGLAFSAAEDRLFVVDSEEHHIRVFDRDGDRLTGGDVFAADPRGYDGIRFDDQGRLWCAAEDGLHCYHPDGSLLGELRVPEVTANLTFGGRQNNVLFLTATTSLYLLRVNFRGARYP